MLYLLGSYQRELDEYLSSSAYAPVRKTPRRAVANAALPINPSGMAPMVTTTWGQGAPYNSACPQENGVHTPAGCVAVSAAQMMKYHEQPATGTGAVSYTTGSGIGVTYDFASTSFDWSNMLNSYDNTATDAQVNAVATLMAACGAAFRMDYSTTASGTTVANMALGLVQNLGYDADMALAYRDHMSLWQWHEVLLTELNQNRPLIFTGVSDTEGHSFLIDGYANDDADNPSYHINWGWEGNADGYFKISALNPTRPGTDASAGGYTSQQSVLLNCIPDNHTVDMNSRWEGVGASVMPAALPPGSEASFTVTLNNVFNMAVRDFDGYMSCYILNGTQEIQVGESEVMYGQALHDGFTSLPISCQVPAELPVGTYEIVIRSHSLVNDTEPTVCFASGNPLLVLSENALSPDIPFRTEINGIHYILQYGEATVTHADNEERCEGSYAGAVVIPDTVIYNGISYPVTAIGNNAFYSCSSLTSISIPTRVTSIGENAFYNCINLTTADLPDSLAYLGNFAFYYCKKLQSITLPYGMISLGQQAFYNCKSLTSVFLPASLAFVGGGCFARCNLSSATWSNPDFSRYPDHTFAGGNFTGNPNLTAITVVGDGVFRAVDGVLFSENALVEYPCGKTGPYVVPAGTDNIWQYAFQECRELSEVTIPHSVKVIMSNAFAGCRNLNNVYMGDSVTIINDLAFEDCTSLTSVTLPGSLRSLGYQAFYGCSSLRTVVLPASLPSIGSSAFYLCTALNTVTIPDAVETIGDEAFYMVNHILYNGTATGSPWGAKCVNGYEEGWLVYTSPARVKLVGCSTQATGPVTIPSSVTAIGDNAFSGCTRFTTSVTVPNSVTEIGEHAFEEVTNVIYEGSATGGPWDAKCVNGYEEGVLVYESSNKTRVLACFRPTADTVVIPSTVTGIGYRAFKNCSNIPHVVIPTGVTYIDDNAFECCTGLSSVTIPQTLEAIGNNALSGCSGLTSITCKAMTPPTAQDNTFNDVNKSIPVCVPAGSGDAYRAATGWSEFTNIQEDFEPVVTDLETMAAPAAGSVEKVIDPRYGLVIIRGDKRYTASGLVIE